MNYFVVMQVGYTYNDENYEKNEGGTPEQVFTDRTLTNAEKDRLTAKRIAGLGDELGMYGYDWNDISSFSKREAAAKLDAAGIKSIDPIEADGLYTISVPAGLTDAQVSLLVELFDKLEFYTVVEVPSGKA